METLLEGRGKDKLMRGESVWGGVQLPALRAGPEDEGGQEKEGVRGCQGRSCDFKHLERTEGPWQGSQG